MKALLVLAVLAAAGFPALAAADDPFQQGLKAEARGDSETALKCFMEADRAKPNDAQIDQRIARQYADLSDVQPTVEKRKEAAQRALNYAELADKLEPHNAEHVLSLAISHGKLGILSDTRTKIAYSRLVKKEAEEAVALDPNYAWAHYVLGTWNYKVANLARTARFFVNVFYGGLPDASNAAAIRELKRATELDPKQPAHWIELGFAYSAAGQPQEARKAWQKGMELPGQARFETEAKARAQSALASNG